jgi:hypothetical protein
MHGSMTGVIDGDAAVLNKTQKLSNEKYHFIR